MVTNHPSWDHWESHSAPFLPDSDFSCLFFFTCEGEDPLAGDQNDHDMDSIAGVLKLYFRGLEHPLFPKDIFHDLIACVSKYLKRNRINSSSLVCHFALFPSPFFLAPE